MRRIYKDLTEINELIAALKASVDERQKIIDMLVTKGVEKDCKIADLELQLKMLVMVIRARRNN